MKENLLLSISSLSFMPQIHQLENEFDSVARSVNGRLTRENDFMVNMTHDNKGPERNVNASYFCRINENYLDSPFVDVDESE